VAVLATAAGLASAVAPAAASAHMTLLEEGSNGPVVAQVQRALGLNGTGFFGPVTRRFVIAFQRKDGLLVDGIVGPQTWGALFGANRATTSYHSASTGYTGSSSGYRSSTYYHSTSTTTSYTRSSSSYSGGYSVPSSIVQCESGGNWSAVNPSSGAGGAYQILPSTWAAYGGQGAPQDASPAEQSRIAGEIYARQGASAWVCK
jgi:peptidoglycan hydrolase-like protein with peptidoglycan-binding domain